MVRWPYLLRVVCIPSLQAITLSLFHEFRDLKLENFIFESKEESSNVKLIDFGLSSKYGSSLRRMHTMVGSNTLLLLILGFFATHRSASYSGVLSLRISWVPVCLFT